MQTMNTIVTVAVVSTLVIAIPVAAFTFARHVFSEWLRSIRHMAD